ncbi:MAG: hypothetical protein NTY38_16725 [Acidobacteria bacterium]|nr:hypothetical protein [Acidobacteriota bacterium]
MADQLYLSYWLRGFSEQNMLRHFEKLLRTFPYSRLSPSGPSSRIYAPSYREPALDERSYPEATEISTILADARHYRNPDCAYLLSAEWDLWQFEEDWRLAPSPVELICFGPAFENEEGDHLRVEFGIDEQFLPQPGLPNGYYMAKSNIQGLLHFVHQLDDALNAEHRRLWTESGENFATRLQEALAAEA